MNGRFLMWIYTWLEDYLRVHHSIYNYSNTMHGHGRLAVHVHRALLSKKKGKKVTDEKKRNPPPQHAVHGHRVLMDKKLGI